jgi:hypothetical protein
MSVQSARTTVIRRVSRMIRFALLLLLSGNLYAAAAAVDIDTAAQVYQAAAIREQVRASLGAMPARMRQLFAGDPAAKLSDKQLAAVTAAAERGFRIDVFEPPALNALAERLDAATVKKTLGFLTSELGRRMVAADVAVARLDETAIDKVTNSQLGEAGSPRRDALLTQVERASQSTESTVQIYLSMGRALAIGTAIGSGLDPVAADERVRKSGDSSRKDMEESLRGPLHRYIAYGYRELSDADLKQLLGFLESKAGKRYVAAYIASLGAGFDAMGRRCGEQIGESWRDLAQAQLAAPGYGPEAGADSGVPAAHRAAALSPRL